MSRRAAALLAALLVAGCESLPQPIERALGPSPVEAAIDYGARAAGMSADELRKETAAAARELAANPSSSARMRVALLLATPGNPAHDDARAASLLAPLAAPESRDPLAPLARVLAAQIAAREREARRAAALKGELDAARAQAETARGQAESARAQAEAARAHVEALRSQLEALKALERSMIERGARPPQRGQDRSP